MRFLNMLIYGLLLVAGSIWYVAGREKEERLRRSFRFIRSHGTILLVLLLFNTISFLYSFEKGEEKRSIVRDDYGGEAKEIELLLGDDIQEKFTLTVEPRQLDQETCEKKIQEAFSYLESNLQGENKDLEHVYSALCLELPLDQYPFSVELSPSDYSLIDEEGNVRNEEERLLAEGYKEQELQQGIPTSVTVLLWYGEEKWEREYFLRIFPEEKSAEQKKCMELKQELKKQEQKTRQEETFILPTKVMGIPVIQAKGGLEAGHILIFGVAMAGLLLIREQEQKKQAQKEREKQLLQCYPWFVNVLVLLLGAGMQVKNIFSALVKEQQEDLEEPGTEGRKILIEELKKARQHIDMGMPEEQAYYQLGRRLRLPCYVKLMTLLEQNVKKGAKGLTALLEQEEQNAFEQRKNLAKRYGEEASTKLLGPMVLLLLVVMLLIMVPAFMSL